MNFLYQIFSEDLIYALGWTVLHSLWQALAIGLLMAVGMLFLQQKSAKVRYELSAFSLFLVFISALVTFLVYYEIAQTTADFTALTLQATAEGADQAKPVAIAATSLQNLMQYFNQHIPLIVTVWFLGACFFLFRLMGGLVYIQRIKYTNNKPAPKYWVDRLQKLRSKIRLRRSVTLVESSLATVPMVIGYFKPLILMPMGAINGLSESEVEAILAHELAHIYRSDFLINIFLSVIEVLFYFNPAVWWIAANVRTERENCCDDIAIKLCGSSLTYAKALLNLQEISQSVPGYAMTFAGSKNQLLQRVKRILNQRRTKSNMFEKFTATSLLLVTVVLFSIGANSYNYNQALQQQHFSATLNSLIAEEQQEDQNIFFDIEEEDSDDIIPKKKNNKQRYIKKSDGGEVELEIAEGDISRLVIDGAEISSTELEEYDELVDNLIEEMEAVPKSPAPTPAPKCMPTPTAPAFVQKHKKTITTETEDNGQTRIIIQSEGTEPTEIVINDGQEFIFIDGTRLEGGDTAVIIDEKNSFSFAGNEDTYSFSHDDFSFDMDFTFDIANFENMNGEEAKEALRKSAESFEEVMTLRKMEMKEMYENLQNQQAAINLQLKQLYENNTNAHAWPEKQLKDKRQRQKTEEQKQDWKERKETINLKRYPRQKTERNDKDVFTSEMKTRENVVRREYHWVNVVEKQESEEYIVTRFDDHIQNAIVKELMVDELIRNENNYSIELTRKSFRINGRKQAASVGKKYLKLYEKLSGHRMNRRSQIHYRNENGRTKSNFRSSGIYYPEREQFTYYFFRGPESYPMKIAKPRQLEGLETLKIQLLPVNVIFELINS